MLVTVHPKLPMRNKQATRNYYQMLGFNQQGGDYDDYLMLRKDNVEIHFFLFKDVKPEENYGQVYIRTNEIEKLYESLVNKGVQIHPNGGLQTKPWGQKEFSVLDPDNNLLTFGESA
ncbi:MAG: VOC family protein [Chitinophagales bacterium]